MLSTRARAAATIAAAAMSLALGLAPMGASAAPSPHHAATIRAYDTSMLSHVNNSRSTYGLRNYAMNKRLWKVAHHWAEHLAHTGTLEHNPKLVHQISAACPNWSTLGENVGVVYGTSVTKLFEAYMHSPPHRANILDRQFTEVGIATVQVVRNGVTEQWDVMDFGNHCP